MKYCFVLYCSFLGVVRSSRETHLGRERGDERAESGEGAEAGRNVSPVPIDVLGGSEKDLSGALE